MKAKPTNQPVRVNQIGDQIAIRIPASRFDAFARFGSVCEVEIRMSKKQLKNLIQEVQELINE